MRVTKAVIPAAGLGTRFLPATKATPKEMLPVVDKPAIQYVVEEAVAAGLTDVLMITGRNKRPLEDHFDRNCGARGGAARPRATPSGSRRVRESSDLADCTTSARATRRASGHAVLCAARHVGDEPFAVLLGDDLIDARDPLLTTDDRGPRAARRQRRRADGGAARADPPLRLRRRRARPDDGRTSCASPTWSRSRRRRTRRATSRSSAATCSTPPSSTCCARRRPGRGGEIQLTDALRALAADPAERRRRCTASSSAAAATTPATGSTTSRPSCGWPASATTSGPDFRAVAARVRRDRADG